MTSASLKRNITLDVLRGIAVMLVLISHIHILPSLGLNFSMKALRGVTVILNHGGWVGVDLFFVLSGFLVSGLLFNEYKKTGRINAGRFLIRRGFKIYPSFYVFMGLSICIGLLGPAFYHPTSLYIPDLLFIRNYIPGQWIYWHTWSLDVEEHFYLLLTLAFFIAIKFNRINFKTLAGTYVLLLFIGFICRFFVNLNNPEFDFQTQYTQTHIRLDALFFGVVPTSIYSRKKN
jgi:peptidoglycan/LPS O-acetylase OafA/YrhL